jgi:virginiamycin B lyase
VVLIAGPFSGLAATVTARAAAAAVTQYTDPTIADPTSIAPGPDGALWFTNSANSSIGRITTAGVITNYTDPSIADPISITAGPDGALWFTNHGNSSIGRITTAGVITNYTDPTIASPIDITDGPDGALWFTNFNNSVGRISIAGAVTNFTDSSIADPTSISAGPDGALWFTNYDSSSIGRITTAGGITNYPDLGGGPNNITAGPDGALWFTNNGNHSIGRITTTGTVTDFSDPGIADPFSIAAGPDGALWFTNNGNHSIGRITTTGTVTQYSDPGIADPLGITAGPDGAMWFDNVGDNSIGRITTASVPAARPDAPTVTSVTSPGVAAVSVAFTPGFDGGAPVMRYTAACVSLDRLPTGTANGPASPIVVTGLVSQYPYQCTVTATNLVGTSAPSAPSRVIWPGATGTGCGMPSAPSVLSTATGNASAVVSWAPAASGCVAGYVVTPFLGSRAELSDLIPGQGTTTVIPRLVNGSTYRFAVAAENGSVEGPASEVSGPVTVGVPGAVTAAHITKVAANTLEVSFAIPVNNGASITRYTAICTSSNLGATKSTAARTGPLTVTALTAGKIYTCAVTATNSRGTSRPSPPSKPVKA